MQVLTRYTIVGILAMGLGLASQSFAQDPQPMNVIILLADDLGLNDLPYFSPAIDQAAYTSDFPIGRPISRGERNLIRPALNRFAARTYSSDPTGSSTADADFGEAVYLEEGQEISYSVKPIDQLGSGGYYFGGLSGNCDDPATTNTQPLCSQCSPTCLPEDCCDPAQGESCCDPSQDILRGVGGLARLAREGVIFPRFYANSTKCAPSRAAFFTGRYHRRTGVTINGADLPRDEVTIAEFLKQGCRDNSTNYNDQCFDWEKFAPCGCYAEDPADCASAPCYRTGLIGKWHLGHKDHAAWEQGFDEYFGFGGGSRHYWKTSKLQCSPAPKYCRDDATVCDAPSDCDDVICKTDGYCADNRFPCTANAECQKCEPRALYIGAKPHPDGTTGETSFNPCSKEFNLDPDCCDDTTGRGRYDVKKRIGADTPEEGKDVRTNDAWPCSDDGLTKNANCAYLTRVLRDQARNFIVRNSDQQPYFLMVSFHATHRAPAAPMRTENHYRTTTVGGERLRPRQPTGTSKYWGSLEELDAAVGEILAVLDQTGVCEGDPHVACSSAADCTSQGLSGECLPVGRCSDTAAACGGERVCTGGANCETQSEHTLVLFFSDHGKGKGVSDYGKPNQRGGKGDVFEGGVRVGLLARGAGGSPYRCVNDASQAIGAECDPDDDPTTCATGETCRWLGNNPAVASIVDVFATVARATGYPLATDGRIMEVYPDRACSVTNAPCAVNADCSPNVCDDGTAAIVDSKSFLDQIDVSLGATPVRDFAYASYPGKAGSTIVTRDEFFHDDDETTQVIAEGVCAYADIAVSSPFRNLRGASCRTCDPRPCTPGPSCDDTNIAHPTYCSDKTWCKLPGKVCTTQDDAAVAYVSKCNPMSGSNSKDYCTSFTPDADAGGLAPQDSDLYFRLLQCQGTSDCPNSSTPQLKCFANVWTKCNKCVPATWKLASRTDASNPKVKGLFDLRSNPDEEERLNFKYQDCDDEKPEIDSQGWGSGNDQARVKAVIDQLRDDVTGTVGDNPVEKNLSLHDWIDCAHGSSCTNDHAF